MVLGTGRVFKNRIIWVALIELLFCVLYFDRDSQ